MKQRLLVNPNDAEAPAFLSVLNEWKTFRQETALKT